jgi:hypothetical protein
LNKAAAERPPPSKKLTGPALGLRAEEDDPLDDPFMKAQTKNQDTASS